MSDHESITGICHETRMLRLRAAEVKSESISATQELGKSLKQFRALAERLRGTQRLLQAQARHRPPSKRPKNQRGSAR